MTTLHSSRHLRPLRPEDLPEADRIFRRAFGTFLGLPDPMLFTGDAATVNSRWNAFPEGAFGVEVEASLAGSVFASRWGSFGFFGPLAVHPDHWGKGLGKVLMGSVMASFDAWGTTHAGLYTFPHSPQHLGLYGAFGFRPRFLTLVMGKNLAPAAALDRPLLRYSELPEDRKAEALGACRRLADRIHGGLDLSREIESLESLGTGDTILLEDASGISGFALCHSGPGSEAGSGQVYLKFAAVAPGDGAAGRLANLLEACEGFALSQGQGRVVAGVNTARTRAVELLAEVGYQTFMSGIALHKPNDPGFCREDAFVLDDWR